MASRDPIHLLVVDPDERFRAAVRRTVGKLAVVDEAGSCHEAATALARARDYGAFIVESVLPDGSGLEWLASARHAAHYAPALVVISKLDKALVNRAFDLDARPLCKPIPWMALRSFVGHAARSAPPARPSAAEVIDACIRAWSEAHGLTPTEARIVRVALMRERRVVASELRLSESTVKTHVKGVLRKLGAKSLVELRTRALTTNGGRE